MYTDSCSQLILSSEKTTGTQLKLKDAIYLLICLSEFCCQRAFAVCEAFLSFFFFITTKTDYSEVNSQEPAWNMEENWTVEGIHPTHPKYTHVL